MTRIESDDAMLSCLIIDFRAFAADMMLDSLLLAEFLSSFVLFIRLPALPAASRVPFLLAPTFGALGRVNAHLMEYASMKIPPLHIKRHI